MSTSCISASVVGKRGRLFEHLKRKKTTSSSDVRLAKNCANASLTSRKKPSSARSLDQLLLFSSDVFFLSLSFLLSLYFTSSTALLMWWCSRAFVPLVVAFFFYMMIVVACWKKEEEEGKRNRRIKDRWTKSSVNSARMHPYYWDKGSWKSVVPDPDLSYSNMHRINMRKKTQCVTNHYN